MKKGKCCKQWISLRGETLKVPFMTSRSKGRKGNAATRSSRLLLVMQTIIVMVTITHVPPRARRSPSHTHLEHKERTALLCVSQAQVEARHSPFPGSEGGGRAFPVDVDEEGVWGLGWAWDSLPRGRPVERASDAAESPSA